MGVASMWDFGVAALTLAAAAHLALAVAVLAASPRSRPNQALALYAGGPAFPFVALTAAVEAGVSLEGWVGNVASAASIAGLVTATVGLAWLGLVFPIPLAWRDARVRRAAGFAAVIALCGVAWSISWHLEGIRMGDPMSPLWAILGASIAEMLLRATQWGVLALFALRHASEPALRRPMAIVGAALVAPVALRAGQFLHTSTSFPFPGETALRMGPPVLGLGVVMFLWGREMARSDRPRALWPLVWLPLVAAIVGMLLNNQGSIEAFLVAEAAVALLAVSLLAYALADRALPRRARRLRWGIGGSSLTALAVAVFFVASETAQQFFGERAGPYAGIAITGLLVFAAAPLQRAAERLAEGGGREASPGRPQEGLGAEEAFRAALRLALRDRALTQDEELALAVLADRLGLSHRRARELRLEAVDARRKLRPAGRT